MTKIITSSGASQAAQELVASARWERGGFVGPLACALDVLKHPDLQFCIERQVA